MNELLVVAVLAVAWWVPTFICISDTQRRTGVRRVLIWKWWTILLVPVAGWILYRTRGRAELDRDAEQVRKRRR
jgi:type VI protein secretion system component VasK